eukprot:1890204-Rhodomonas_salina.1
MLSDLTLSGHVLTSPDGNRVLRGRSSHANSTTRARTHTTKQPVTPTARHHVAKYRGAKQTDRSRKYGMQPAAMIS